MMLMRVSCTDEGIGHVWDLAEKFWIISTEQNPYWRFGVFTTIPVIQVIFYLVNEDLNIPR